MSEAIIRFVQSNDRRRINAYLLEGLFFHRSDNPHLFEELHKNRSAFKDFWEEHFGVELVVRDDVAYRRHQNEPSNVDSGFRNPSIRPEGRMHFYFAGVDGKVCLLIFQSFLYWYETQLRNRQPVAYGEYSFTNQEFWSYVNGHLDQFFADTDVNVPAHKRHKAFKAVLRRMQRFGFIKERDRVHVKDMKGRRPDDFRDDYVVDYLARPGLTAYDAYRLQENPSQFEKAFGIKRGEDDQSQGEEE